MTPYSIPLWTIFTKWPAPEVVDHLHEVARARGAAVQIAVLGRRRIAGAAGRPLGGAVDAGRDRLEDRVEPLDRLVGPADHQAVAALEPPDTAARADVEVVDAARLERLGAVDVVAVVGVAAVDDRVAGLHQPGELVDGVLDVARRDHDPGVPGSVQLGDEVGERIGARGPLAGEPGDGIGADVVDHALVAVPHQPANHVRAHPAEADHPELHPRVSSRRFDGATARPFLSAQLFTGAARAIGAPAAVLSRASSR
jgi:hypothetical protein